MHRKAGRRSPLCRCRWGRRWAGPRFRFGADLSAGWGGAAWLGVRDGGGRRAGMARGVGQGRCGASGRGGAVRWAGTAPGWCGSARGALNGAGCAGGAAVGAPRRVARSPRCPAAPLSRRPVAPSPRGVRVRQGSCGRPCSPAYAVVDTYGGRLSRVRRQGMRPVHRPGPAPADSGPGPVRDGSGPTGRGRRAAGPPAGHPKRPAPHPPVHRIRSSTEESSSRRTEPPWP